MATEARFVRTETAEGARFEITPAPQASSPGCLLIGGLGITGAIAYAGAQVGVVGFLASAVLWVPMLIFIVLVSLKTGEKYSRAPVTLIVNETGITAGERFFSSESIAELVLRHPSDDGGARYQWQPTSGAVALGQAAAASAANCSFALMARLKSGSAPELLVFGLTYHTGAALLNDVIAALTLTRSAPPQENAT